MIEKPVENSHRLNLDSKRQHARSAMANFSISGMDSTSVIHVVT